MKEMLYLVIQKHVLMCILLHLNTLWSDQEKSSYLENNSEPDVYVIFFRLVGVLGQNGFPAATASARRADGSTRPATAFCVTTAESTARFWPSSQV